MKDLVLVVDDEPSTNALAAEYLRLAGFEAAAADGVESALALLAGGLAPRLILLDRRLSDGDGLELCARLKADPARAGVPVLILSAYGAPPPDLPADARPDAWMEKPFRPKDLVAEVRRLLAQRAA
jgi:CheY-like chemotaxis protein